MVPLESLTEGNHIDARYDHGIQSHHRKPAVLNNHNMAYLPEPNVSRQRSELVCNIEMAIVRIVLSTNIILCATSLTAQNNWQSIVLSDGHKHVSQLKAIGIRGTLLGGDGNEKVLICLSTRCESKLIDLCIVSPLFEKLFPSEVLDDFRGPGISSKITNARPMTISFNQNGRILHFKSGIGIESNYLFPNESHGEAEEMITSNVTSGPMETKTWNAFMKSIRQGFESGKIILNFPKLSHPIIIQFGGNGFKPLMNELFDCSDR
jgi:hypothetical protein